MQCVRNSFLKQCATVFKTNRTQIRHSSYKTSILVDDQSKFKTLFERTNLPEDWKYVERVLPVATIPEPQPKEKYASQWKPPSAEVPKAEYFIARTKNHMIPVYLDIGFRGTRRTTMVKKIQGNIWSLEAEIRELLQKDSKKPIRTRVNEFIGNIVIHGDHVAPVRNLLLQKGF